MSQQKTLFRDMHLHDAHEQQVAQDWLPLEINQLSAGKYQGQLREIRKSDVSVIFEHQNCTVHKRGVMDEKFCTVSFFRTTNSLARFSEYSPIENSLFFLPSGTEFDILARGDAETIYFRFDQSQLLHRSRAMDPVLWESKLGNLLIFNTLDRKPLDAFVNHLYASPIFQNNAELITKDDELGRSIMDQVVMTLSSSCLNEDAQPDLNARRRARLLVKQVIEYIDAAMEKQLCPSIVDICMDINVSQRNLQYIFKKILGITPHTYIYRLRLNRVRAQLSNPVDSDITVTRVATGWHFWHLGRFANDYLKLFGEKPSATLRRALA